MKGFCDNCGDEHWTEDLCAITLRWKPHHTLSICERCGQSLRMLLQSWLDTEMRKRVKQNDTISSRR